MAKKKSLDPALRRKLEGMLSEHDDNEEIDVVTTESIEQLKEVGRDFLAKNRFQQGDLVEWKPGCKNKRMPPHGRPAIVVDVLETPIYDQEEKNSGSAYFREPLDLVCGFIDRDGDFLLFYFDSRRFRLFQGE